MRTLSRSNSLDSRLATAISRVRLKPLLLTGGGALTAGVAAGCAAEAALAS